MPEYKFTDRLRHAWNAFTNRDPTPRYQEMGVGYSYRPDRYRLTRGNERSIINAIYNRIAIDVAAIDIRHVRVDENEQYLEEIDSGIDRIFNLSANIDQTGRAFIQDAVMSMLDEGVIALVPVDTTINPRITGSYDIETMRVGKITQWFPKHVKVDIYNEENGRHQEVLLPKTLVAIIENPLYSVMNEPNSTAQRLNRKLVLLDSIDEQSGSGKLDLIIQLPYVIKSQSRRNQAEARRKDIEMQLAGSKYGIAYTDGTEKITQLNRPVENNLMTQIEFLTSMLYGQLGVTEDIIKGTADDKTQMNYYTRTIEPILSAFTNELKRKFLTKTARTQGQSFMFFRNPFALASVTEIAEIADKFTRNEILSSNEIRGIIGYRPSSDPKADELRNSNINQNEQPMMEPGMEEPMMEPGMEEQPMMEPEMEEQLAEQEEINPMRTPMDVLNEQLDENNYYEDPMKMPISKLMEQM